MNVRRLAFDTLLRTERGGYANLALDAIIKKQCLEPRDRALLTALVMGVIERQVTLDYYIDALSSLPPSKIDAETRILLRLGLYQLKYLEKIPAHAAVSETVELAPRRSRGFVNALLRQYLRTEDKIALPDRKKDISLALSVEYSFPLPLAKRFVAQFGEGRAESIMAAFCRPPMLTLRVNTLKSDRDTMLSRFAEAGIAAEPTKYAAHGISLDSRPVLDLPGFAEGEIYVQDEASQLCVAAISAAPDTLVADICSAPGSKSFGAAQSMQNRGKILAFDLHESKLSLIRSSAARLGITIIEASAADGRSAREELLGKVDTVICDVPCSGYGVLAKKPEIRHKDPADSAALPAIQYDILSSCCRYLRSGGRLIYSTCTLFEEENYGNIKKFLSTHNDFELTPFKADALDLPSGYITLAPDTHGTDGFFIAVLTKK